MADMAAFSRATGLRQANVTGLQWSQVDLMRKIAWIHPDQAKTRKAIAVPLNEEARLIVQKQLGKHRTHVFSFRGQPITQVSTKAWYAALKRAGIEISGGTICDTPGRAGTFKAAHCCMSYKSWADGRVRRWCGATRIYLRSISRHTLNA